MSDNKEVFVGISYKDMGSIEEAITRSLEKVKGIKELRYNIGNLNIGAFAMWNALEIQNRLMEINNIMPGKMKVVEASILE